MKEKNNILHPVVLFIKKKLKHYGRRDYCFGFEPLKNTRVEVHRVVDSPFLFIRVARKIVNKVTETLVIEEWIPIEEYKFFFGKQGNIRKGDYFPRPRKRLYKIFSQQGC